MQLFRRIFWIALCGISLCGATPVQAASRYSYLLNDSTFDSDMHVFYRWTGMMQRFREQQLVPDEKCDKVAYHPCYGINEWRKLLKEVQGTSIDEQMRRVNDFANAFTYINDVDNWGKDNVWETPYEFLTVSGNCKDYAIMKYYSLRKLGIPASRLRVIVLEDLNLGGVIHAILGIYKGDELYILDNQIKQVRKAESIYHYKPIYAINEEGWWMYKREQ